MEDKGPLKVYIWESYSCDYTCGLAVAVAHSADDARDLIEAEHGYRDAALANRPVVIRFNGKPQAFAVSGGG